MSEGGVYYNYQQAVEFVLLAVASVEVSTNYYCKYFRIVCYAEFVFLS
jgi:hypothetical protein